jgi:tetratricopeptide (TPR) repeat protein
VELFPEDVDAREQLADAYEAKGLHAQAFEVYQQWARMAGVDEQALSRAYESGGMRAFWRKRLEMEKDEAKEGDVWAYRMASLYARNGDREEAFSWLQRAAAERYDRLVFLGVDPVFDSLRSDPRFTDLLKRIGLPR